MFVYEVFLPVADERGQPFAVIIFREACDELAEKFGPVETLAVYCPLQAEGSIVRETELCRCRFDVPSTEQNQQWLVAWRVAKERLFGSGLWMIRYRQI
ncbi:MAG: hypothetical protein HY000_38995 [Planctomycetes bacterium]|nr:hypothetical protein [Planctomycetota bacterium]